MFMVLVDYKGAYIAVIMKLLDDIDKGKSPTIIGDGSEALILYIDIVHMQTSVLLNLKLQIVYT